MTSNADYTKLITRSDDNEFPDSAVKPLMDSEVGGGDHDHADKRGVTLTHSDTPTKTDWKFIARVSAYVLLWYLFNIAYNIFNKRVLNTVSLGWTVSFRPLASDMFYVSDH